MRLFRILAAISLIVAGGLAALAAPDQDFADQDFAQQERLVMVERINGLLDAQWKAAGVTPAARCSDAEFLRRAYLDLTGVIPNVSEVRQFLADDSPDKRKQLVERLLTSPAYATHMANTWRNIMLPRGFESDQVNNVVGVQNWLRDHFVNNMRYDRVVSDLLVATGGGNSGPALFYSALQLKPEELAANTARIFLGLQIQCAQCHDHPFDRWTQRDFWGYAAFFSRLQQSNGQMNSVQLVDLESGEVTLPDTDVIVMPKFPGGPEVKPSALGTRRQQLSIWMASRDNPYLPRAAVNWAWSHMFGRGLVEPVDDIGPHNPPNNLQLMDELTDYFIHIGFDLKELFRTLAAVDAYHLCSYHEEDVPQDLHARMIVKVLTPEQLYDSLARATLRNPSAAAQPGGAVSPLFDPRRRQFIANMQAPGREPWEYQAGLPQALMLMNGQEMVEATDPQQSGMLRALQAPWLSDEDCIETIFLATYARYPTDEEQSQFLSYVRSGGTTGEHDRALGDVFWALLNSAEFALNH